jgi:tetratricopeptide (TPR) repeat protein
LRNILLEMGKYDDARQMYERGLKMTLDSNLSPEIKENTRQFHHYNLGRVALARKDYKAASWEAGEFRKGAESSRNTAQTKQAHELAGMIALEQKNYDQAIAELQQANLQNPYNLYRLGQAYQGKNEQQKAQDFFAKAARFNSLPQLNYAFIRNKAEKMAGAKS